MSPERRVGRNWTKTSLHCYGIEEVWGLMEILWEEVCTERNTFDLITIKNLFDPYHTEKLNK